MKTTAFYVAFYAIWAFNLIMGLAFFGTLIWAIHKLVTHFAG